MANPEWTEPESWYEALIDPVSKVIRAGDVLYRHLDGEMTAPTVEQAKTEWDRAVHALTTDSPLAARPAGIKPVAGELATSINSDLKTYARVHADTSDVHDTLTLFASYIAQLGERKIFTTNAPDAVEREGGA